MKSLNILYIYTTWNCNFKCIHCWVDGGEQTNEFVKKEDLFELIRQGINMGLKQIKWTGGEPLLCWELIKETILAFPNIRYFIESNGYLLDEEKIVFLREHKVAIAISLNGKEAKEHDGFVQKRGAFEKVVENIKQMISLNWPPMEIIQCVYKSNMDNLEENIAFYHGLGVQCVKLNPIINMGRSEGLLSAGLLPEAKDYLEINRRVNEYRRKTNKRVFLHQPMCLRNCENLNDFGSRKCGIENMLSLLPDGQLSICGYGGTEPEALIGKWEKGSELKKIWEENAFLQNLHSEINEEIEGICGKCIYERICKGDCKALSFKKYRKWNAPSPICQELYEQGLFPESRIDPRKN